jgi:hypothetical protein
MDYFLKTVRKKINYTVRKFTDGFYKPSENVTFQMVLLKPSVNSHTVLFKTV